MKINPEPSRAALGAWFIAGLATGAAIVGGILSAVFAVLADDEEVDPWP